MFETVVVFGWGDSVIDLNDSEFCAGKIHFTGN